MAGIVGIEPTMPVSKTGALTSWLYPIIVVIRAGLEPTTALSTGFTVRGDTNYTVLTHKVEPVGIEPATPRFSVWRSALR